MGYIFPQTCPLCPQYHFSARSFYLRCRLEDPELLCRGQRCVQRDNQHGAAAVWQMLGDVPTCPRQSLDLLLTRHEDQDIMGRRGLLRADNKEILCSYLMRQERSSQNTGKDGFSCRIVFFWEGKKKSNMRIHMSDYIRNPLHQDERENRVF